MRPWMVLAALSTRHLNGVKRQLLCASMLKEHRADRHWYIANKACNFAAETATTAATAVTASGSPVPQKVHCEAGTSHT